MTSDSRSSASYAYYSFPPTPHRSSPPQSSAGSEAKSPASEVPPQPSTPTKSAASEAAPRTPTKSTSMAPSPAAGKASSATSNPPKTPTKAGKNPSSSATSKLGQSQSAADSPKGAAKSATDTPKQASKGPAEKAKSSASSEKSETRSPKLPPRPKGDAAGAGSKAKEAAPPKLSKPDKPLEDVKEKGDEAKKKAEDAKEDAKGKVEDVKDKTDDVKEDTKPELDLKDNDPAEEADNEDTDAPVGKVSQGGNDTGAEEESSAEGELDKAAPQPIDDEEDEAGDAEDAPETGDSNIPAEAKEEAGKATGAAKKKAGDTKDKISGAAGGLAGKANGAKDTADKASEGDVKGATKDAEDGVEDADDEVKNTAEHFKDDAEDVADDAKADAEDTAENVKDDAEDVVDDAKADAQDAAEKVEDDAESVADDTGSDVQVNVAEDTEDAVNGTKDAADDAAADVEDDADDAVDDVDDIAEDVDDLPDLSVLKGLEVGEGGKILGADGEQIGQLDEGDPEDLVGKTIGDDGEILDEDGDVIGRASVLPDKAKEVADQTAEDLPEIGVLDGLEVGEDGNILGSDGTPLGKIVEGDPKDLIGLKLNDKGEIVDEDGDVIGRAEVVPGEASKKVEDVADDLANGVPDIDALQGQTVGEDGQIAGDDGAPLGKIFEGDLEDVVGQQVNEKGEVLDHEGDVIGKAEVIAQDVEDKLDDGVPQELKDQLNPNLSILNGRKVNKKGNILDDEGEVIGKLSEDSDLKQCIGKKPNEEGEILNDKGNVVGKVEIVTGEAADEIMKTLHPEIVEKIEKAAEEAATKAATPDLSILEGLKVNKKGEVLNEDGEPIGKLVDGEIKDVAGKKINDKGEVLDKDGNVIGKVEVIPPAIQEAKEDTEEAKEDAEGAADDAEGAAKGAEGAAEGADGAAEGAEGAAEGAEGAAAEAQGAVDQAKDTLPDISVLEGLKVNKKGEVVNEEGDPIARVSEGELSDLVGKKINENGEVLDSEGKVIGKVELIPQEPEGDQPEDEAGEELPPLSILEGLKCNKSGKIVNADGKPLGELVEGDAKKLSKLGVQSDAEGLFWDDKGHVIGRAQTLPQKDDEEDAPFAGLEGLIVVKDGFVEDINENKVGVIVEGDPKKLVGRAVDEDGDVLDKRGNVVGHADRFEEPEPEDEPEVVKPDLSILKGLTVNKQGNVVGPEGIPIARLVEGNAKELGGKKLDDEGQFWNDEGKVIGRVELIPENERDVKVEGPFAGLEGLVVVKDGKVEDEDGNIVGQIVEGDPKKLIGRAVDEDGDIVDKYGNVKGHAEPYEEPEEAKLDLSVLKGLTVNKQGNIIGPEGIPIGRLIEGNPKELAGKKLDEEGQIWNDSGKVIGRAELIPEKELESKAESPFAGLEGLVVVKDGKVEDEDGNVVGQIVEGDSKKLIGRAVDEDGDIVDKYGNVKGHAEPYEEPEEAKLDLSVLKGLTVNKQGNIIGPEGIPIGRLIEGNPKELAGKKLDEEGQIWNDSGKVIGRAELIPENELESKAEGPFAGLEGLVVVKDGKVEDEDGNVVGQIVEGDSKKLIGRAVDEDGDIVDKYGNVKGHAEPYEEPEEAKLDLSVLKGLTVNKQGNIIGPEGIPIGRLIEGNPKELAGKKLDEEGQIWNDSGKVIGRAELIPEKELESKAESPFAGLEGLVVVKDGKVEDEDGNVVGQIVEGDSKKLIGRAVDEDGDIVDKYGNVKGHAEPYEEPEEAKLDLSVLKGLTVNKQGNIIGPEGIPIGRLIEGNPKELAGKKLDEEGQIWNDSGKVIGRAELIPENELESKAEGPFAGLEGLVVVKDGKVEDEDGNVVGQIVEGDSKKLIGRAVDEDGDILDKYGNVKGRAEPYEEPEEVKSDLSVLKGLIINKQGNAIGPEGIPIGRLVEGNPKELAGKKLDEEGQIWNDAGKVIGRAELIPENERASKAEGPFAGLEGLVVVKDGKVEDEDGNVVGQLIEGDPKKLIGRAVDEDGDIIDKYGNVKGRAEPYEEPDVVKADLSVLKGLTVNKQGNVIGPDGVPIGRLAEGNPKELAGKKVGEEGQIWNDEGRVIGRAELIPDSERQSKPEGSFAGRQGLVVVKGGLVEDEDGNTVGKVVEGDAKKLIGRAVDEDGDIIDKYGNIKGHAEPYEEPEEEEVDLSSLEGKVVNKAGNVVDDHGKVYGRIVSGNPEDLAGRKVDGKGQVWSDNGKVIGHAELIAGGDSGKADGSFSGFEGLVVVKDGLVHDAAGQVVGKLIEGDPVKLVGRKVDEDGDILDKSGNTIGKAERYSPPEKERKISPMAGRKVNKEGEVRDEDGNVIGKLTQGDLASLIGKEIDDDGYVIDNDGNRVGQCTLIENIKEEEPEEEEEEEEEEPEEGPSEEELAKLKQAEEDNELAKKMNSILKQTLDRIEPVCKQIEEKIEAADRTPKDELDEEQLVQDVKPLIEEGGRILQECNGAIRGLDPDGRIAANAKARAAAHEATPEEAALAESLKELTTTVVKTIDNAKKKIADMPHAKKGLNPLWGLLTEPLFQIIAAVGLLLAGVLGLVGKLLNGLGLGGLVNGLLGGLGIDKLLGGLGLGSITESLGLGGGKKKKK